MTTTSPTLETLVSVVLDDVRIALSLLEDRAANEARELLVAAEEHVAGLTRAAGELGDLRGRAAEEALQRDADREIRDVVEGAFERFAERFLLRVRTALEGLRDQPGHAEALKSWARSAARRMDRPTDVRAGAADRPVVYEALLSAGARDFRVLADRDVDVGFVVRDLDGRTLFDARPAAIVAEKAAALREFLRSRVPPPPSAERAPTEGGER